MKSAFSSYSNMCVVSSMESDRNTTIRIDLVFPWPTTICPKASYRKTSPTTEQVPFFEVELFGQA